MRPPRVIVADPRRLIREATAEALEDVTALAVVAATDDAETTILQARRTGADVVLVSGFDLSYSNVCEGLRSIDPRPRALVFDGADDDDSLMQAIVCGVDGYLTGEHGLGDLVEAIRALARGETVVPPSMLGPLLRRLIERRRQASIVSALLDRLTRREREVLQLLVEGLDQEGMAARLTISPETARTHLQRILRKLEVHSRVEAIALIASADESGEGIDWSTERTMT